jgi:hypothetical protein
VKAQSLDPQNIIEKIDVKLLGKRVKAQRLDPKEKMQRKLMLICWEKE